MIKLRIYIRINIRKINNFLLQVISFKNQRRKVIWLEEKIVREKKGGKYLLEKNILSPPSSSSTPYFWNIL